MPKPQIRRAYRIVPKLLKQMREDAGLTQRELAERLKTSQNTIHRMECATRRCDAVELIEWCNACGANPKRVCQQLIDAV